MKLSTAILIALMASPVFAGPYDGLTISTTTGKAERNISGKIGVAASSATYQAYLVTIDGTNGYNSTLQVTASSGTFSGPIAASQFNGSGAGLTAIPSAQLSGAIPANLVSLSTVTTALAGKLSNSATVPSALIDFSTITTALGGKLDTNGSAASLTNFPTLNQNTTGNAGTATALAANGANCSAGQAPLGVNASGAVEGCWTIPADTDIYWTGTATNLVQATARTSLGLTPGTDVQAYDADLADLADGSLTGSKIGDGVPAANIAAGTIPSDVMASSIAVAGFYSADAVRSGLGLAIGSNVQAYDADLADLADGSLTTTKVANLSGTNTGDNAANTTYASDYRAANFVAGTNYLAPNGSAASLTNFPTFNQNTTGNAATATALAADPADCSGVNFARGVAASGAAACAQPSDVTGNSATATKLATARAINGVSFDGSANINIATTSYLADGVSLALTGATFSAKSSSVTLQGNTFNGASQLVKLDALSKLPAVDGSQLLNLPSTSGGAVLASTQTFTGANTFWGATTLNAITFNQPVIISSATSPLSSYTITQTSPINCVTGSTISVTTSQTSKFLVSYAGVNYNSVASFTYAGFKINGVQGGGDSISDHSAASGTSRQNMSFSYLTEAYPAGTYSFCLWLASDAGTMGFVHFPRFSVMAIR